MCGVFKENHSNGKYNLSHLFRSDILYAQIFWIIEYHMQPKRKNKSRLKVGIAKRKCKKEEKKKEKKKETSY